MSTVSLTLPSDGDTIDAADVNTPLNAIAAVINGAIDSTNISAGGVTPANLTSGTGTSWAWTAWTPTLTVIGGTTPTFDCKYTQIGKTVICRLSITFVGGTTMGTGTPTFTLPVTSVSMTASTYLGTVRYNTSTSSPGIIRWASTTTADLKSQLASGTYLAEDALSSTVPGNWGAASTIVGTFIYEAA